MESFKSPPGVFDIVPNAKEEAWRNSHLWNYIEGHIRQIASQYGFEEIRTPLFEKTELFKRSVGETSDIVSKEMYTFEDKGNRSLTLRPEGTAPVIRAFIEHRLSDLAPFHKLFYLAPMFRYERSQAGRYRQHHQFGVEVIGIAAAEQDAELIEMLWTLFNRLGLKDLQLMINSLGTPASRSEYRTALKEYLKSHLTHLSEDSQARFETNPLRILDSKDPKDQQIIENAPSILDFLDEESKAHFDTVKKSLGLLGIPYQINPRLVRGLDYYNKTVFEITAGVLGSQNSIAGGGRYDGLIESLGGPPLPSAGFGMGIERILQTLLKQQSILPKQKAPTLFLIPLGDEAKAICYQIQHQLRNQGIAVQMDYSGKKLNKIMQYANAIAAQFVAVVGDEELKSNEVELKQMATGEKRKAPLYHLGRILTVDSQTDQFINLWQEMSKPFDTEAEAEFFVKRLSETIKNTEHLTETVKDAMLGMQKFLENS